jgi:hypothetical protein
VAMLTIYIDDSGTSPENAVAVAAGWIAQTPSWADFESAWETARNIDGDKFDCMHMAEFVFGQKGTEFEGWSLEKKQRIATRLRGMIKNAADKGFALGIAKKDFDEVVPSALRAQGFESHYTYAIRRVLGMIDVWRQKERITEPIEYVFDWMDPRDPRRKEIEVVFGTAEGEPEALRRYGLSKGGFSFRPKRNLSPLQAADMFAWLMYQWLLNEFKLKNINPIATESFKDFYLHRHKSFLEGGYNKRAQLAEWVRMKGFVAP